MAVAFGSGGTYLTYGSHTNSTLVAPASIANGDLLIAYLAVGTSGSIPTTPTAPAGWSTLTGSPVTVDTGSFNIKYCIFYKIASSESGNYTFTHATYSSCGVVARYTGVDTTTPFSPTPTTNFAVGGNNTITALGFTTTVANTFIIFTEQDWGDDTNDCVPPTGTSPTFTERLDAVILYIADGTRAATGATGNYSHTGNSSSSFNWSAYLIGLNPAAAGGGAPITLSANPGSYALTLGGQQLINIGSAPIDGTGDPARTAFRKCNQNFIALYTADTTFQPLDGDLTAIAALTGTNTIYYRSGTSAWSGVTIGTGLTFTSGMLTATGASATDIIPQCGRLILGATSPASTLKFVCYQGDRFKINGVIYPIPSAGISSGPTSVYVNGVAGQNLVTGTFYYVYLFNNAGTLTFDFSTTAHATSTTAGNVGTEIKSGDDTRTLIGIVYTAGTSPNLFYDQNTARYMRSWFNRLRVTLDGTVGLWGPAGATTYSNSGVPTVAFVQFAGEALSISASGIMYSSIGSNTIYHLLYLDGVTAFGAEVAGTVSNAGWYMPVCCTGVLNNVSEGAVHTIYLYYKVAGGTMSGSASIVATLG